MQTTWVEHSHPETPRPKRATGKAADVATAVEDPELLQARLLLNSLIANPPKGSIPMRIDRPMAQAMLERNHGNRLLRELAVKHLMGVMTRGEWQHNGETIKFTSCGKLNDGQHRLTSVERSGVPITTDVRFGLSRETFDTIDVGAKRTAADVLSIKGVGNASIVAAAARLLWRYEQEPSMASVAPTHRQIEEMVAAEPLLGESAKVAGKYHTEAMLHPSVVAFVWVLAARYDRVKADDFVRKLASGVEGAGKNDPVRVMRMAALKNLTSKAKWPTDYMAALVVKIWIAYAKGKKVTALRWITAGDAPEGFPQAPEA